MKQEVFEQRTPLLPCMVDDLLRCEHGWPVEIAECPRCQKLPPTQERSGNIIGYVIEEIFPETALGKQVVRVQFETPRVTGWSCVCGRDGNHFEHCTNCQRRQPLS